MYLIAALLIAAQPAAPAATEVKPAEKMICRYEADVTTRIKTKRTCRKKTEWDQIAKDTEEDLRRSTNQRHNPGNSPGI